MTAVLSTHSNGEPADTATLLHNDTVTPGHCYTVKL